MSIEDIFSKSKNSPMIGMDFSGKVVMTICGDSLLGNIDNI